MVQVSTSLAEALGSFVSLFVCVCDMDMVPTAAEEAAEKAAAEKAAAEKAAAERAGAAEKAAGVERVHQVMGDEWMQLLWLGYPTCFKYVKLCALHGTDMNSDVLHEAGWYDDLSPSEQQAFRNMSASEQQAFRNSSWR